jgi:hypothetical protein
MTKKKKWFQERPKWCPNPDCEFKRIAVDHICVGKLPEPIPHNNDENTHRMCLHQPVDNTDVFEWQINSSDVSWFRWLFDAIFPMDD